MEPMSFTFQLDRPLMVNNAWKKATRNHKAKMRLTRQLAQDVAVHTHRLKPALRRLEIELPIERYLFKVERRQAGNQPDRDALIGGELKALIDVLQPMSSRHPYGLGIVIDDTPLHLLHLDAKPVRVKTQKENCTVVWLEPVPADVDVIVETTIRRVKRSSAAMKAVNDYLQGREVKPMYDHEG